MKGVSVIVPALDAARWLPRCLEAVRAADSLIVADGGSRDGTVEEARALGAKVVVSARGRGTQLKAGAAVAETEWLLFLHADTVL